MIIKIEFLVYKSSIFSNLCVLKRQILGYFSLHLDMLIFVIVLSLSSSGTIGIIKGVDGIDHCLRHVTLVIS